MENQKWSVEISGAFYFKNEYGEWDATGTDELYVIESMSDLIARDEAIERYATKYYRSDIEIVLEDIIVQEVK